MAHERRGAVLSEFLFVLLQISIYNQPAPLLVVTLIGVFVNTIPRQFYAQLKMLVRALHISYLDSSMECVMQQVRQTSPRRTRTAGSLTFDVTPPLGAVTDA